MSSCSLFANVPAAVSLFGGVNGENINSNEFKAHCIRVVNGLDSAIGLLSDPATLNAQLAHLATQHKAREGVTKGGFSVSTWISLFTYILTHTNLAVRILQCHSDLAVKITT